MLRSFLKFFSILVCVLAIPVLAAAQSQIAGTVTDNTGAVLPGVTVEVASPVLIEKVRTTVTDGQGRYTITNLTPGTYRITSTLLGFGTNVREGLVLPADFIATVNVQLQVGSLEETITVSGASPLVDIQSAARTEVISRDLLDALPTPRNTQSFGYLAQGVRLSKPDVGGSQAMEQVNMRVHGAGPLHTTMQVDGMLISPAFADGAIQNYINQAAFAETSFTTSSQGAEVSAGGIRLNMIGKDGGNIFSGSLYMGLSDGKWQSGNLTPALKAKGLALPTGITNIHDVNPSFGGPILRDKLWFYTSMRWMSVDEKVVNAFMPDGSPAIVDQWVRTPMLRLTAQLTPRNKLMAFLDRPMKFKGLEFTFGIEPTKASSHRDWRRAQYSNAGTKFTSTVSNRILYEAGFTQILERTGSGYQPRNGVFPSTKGYPRPANPHLFTAGPGVDPWFREVSHFDIITNERTVAKSGGFGRGGGDRGVIMTALSYVTGSHNLKGGFQWAYGYTGGESISHGDLNEQRYRLGVPEAVVVNNNPLKTEEWVKADIGLYLQDSWTIKRLTVNAGARYEYFNSMIKAQFSAPGRWVPGRYTDPIHGVPIWKDLVPRLGVAYDLTGDGKTALKFGANKYVRPMVSSFVFRYNPLRAGAGADTRDWFDVDLIPGTSTRSGIPKPTDRDDIVQDSEVGPSNNVAFGSTTPDRYYDKENLKRETNVELTASVQRQLMDGLSVTAGWYRRQFYNLLGEKNTALNVATDFTPFVVANPLNGEPLTIYNQNLNTRGKVRILEYNSDDTQISEDFELSFNSRLRNASTVFGGWTATRVRNVTCETVWNPIGVSTSGSLYTGFVNQLFAGGPFCDERKMSIPYRHDFKLAGTLPLPYGFEFSGTLVSFAGNETQVLWNIPISAFPNGQRTATTIVRLSAPGTRYLERWNQTDIALKKSVRFSKYTLTTQLDLYNVLNSAVVNTENEQFGPRLNFPQTILQGRLPRLVAQIKW